MNVLYNNGFPINKITPMDIGNIWGSKYTNQYPSVNNGRYSNTLNIPIDHLYFHKNSILRINNIMGVNIKVMGTKVIHKKIPYLLEILSVWFAAFSTNWYIGKFSTICWKSYVDCSFNK